MESVSDIRLLFAVLAPLVGAGLVMAFGKKPNLRESISVLAAVTLCGLVLSLVPSVRSGTTAHYTLFELIPADVAANFTVAPQATALTIALRADALSMIFAVVASFLWILAVFYSAGYMRGLQEHAQTRFNVCFALALFGAIGCAFADNLLTLYLFYEIVSVSTYPLVAHHQDEEGYEGGRKYLTYLTTTAKALVFPAIVLIFVLSGTLDFAGNAHTGIIPATVQHGVTTALYIACLLGFAKNGVMPFHHWLPGAMVAPTPVSALLHAVAVVKVGVFSTVRVMLYVFGVDTMDALNLGIPTAYFVSITILVASIIALSKDNLKTRLAYSTVSQLSYIILGVALLTPTAVAGGLFHIAAHAFAKITLFFCAGAIYVATHKKYISEMSGLGRVMPWTFGAFALASLSMIGVPPVGGFTSKLYLLVGSLDAGAIGILVVLIASTLLNAAYFAPVVYQAFFGKPPAPMPEAERIPAPELVAAGHEHDDAPAAAHATHGAAHGHTAPAPKGGEAPLAMVIPLCLTAVLSVLLGFYPDFFMQFAAAVLP
ncbi:monovalent cation/H+ antiporter subunit D family protein [Opitutus terrae]|uniref:NADH dehydrogenase (Quinone) n=1 Tax=Opitutus terrae (strain DSM 11246 / JCM 15787 / PB90-1) TaxID=452637 RepID=B1ZUJ7_OPITP|nr:monovalent cation/H+ antiporter subunit D family protein [Opitutus terrae]ACB74040.1 NADH dehydrogenase (quinone) [Opitutus terrae PB90-1]